MQSITKRIMAISLAVIMLLGIAPLSFPEEMKQSVSDFFGGLSVKASAASFNGTCGDNLTWSMRMNGEGSCCLEIDGEGAMTDYSEYAQTPWCQKLVEINANPSYYFIFDIYSITIGDEVTSIGSNAFTLINEIDEIIIPESVKSIGANAMPENEKTIICGFEGSCAETYADAEGYDFVCIDSKHGNVTGIKVVAKKYMAFQEYADCQRTGQYIYFEGEDSSTPIGTTAKITTTTRIEHINTAFYNTTTTAPDYYTNTAFYNTTTTTPDDYTNTAFHNTTTTAHDDYNNTAFYNTTTTNYTTTTTPPYDYTTDTQSHYTTRPRYTTTTTTHNDYSNTAFYNTTTSPYNYTTTISSHNSVLSVEKIVLEICALSKNQVNAEKYIEIENAANRFFAAINPMTGMTSESPVETFATELATLGVDTANGELAELFDCLKSKIKVLNVGEPATQSPNEQTTTTTKHTTTTNRTTTTNSTTTTNRTTTQPYNYTTTRTYAQQKWVEYYEYPVHSFGHKDYFEVIATYEDGTVHTIPSRYNGVSITSDQSYYNQWGAGEHTATVTFMDKSAEIDVTVIATGTNAENCSLSILNHSDPLTVKTIHYGEKLELTANVKNAPEDAIIRWYIDNNEYATGNTVILPEATENFTVTVKLTDKWGDAILTPEGEEIVTSEVVKVYTGFFWRLVYFLKNLFKLSFVVTQAFKMD